jgi:hypothetical protein
MAEVIETNNTPTKETPATPAPESKTFSEDYVHALREENKNYRTKGKVFEEALKEILKVSDGEELGDIKKRIENFNAANQKALDDANAKATNLMIDFELSKALGDGYNEKLVRKLLDYSSIKIEDGKVTGLAEAIKNLEEEYPEVKKQKAPKLADGTGTSVTGTDPEDEALKAFKRILGTDK